MLDGILYATFKNLNGIFYDSMNFNVVIVMHWFYYPLLQLCTQSIVDFACIPYISDSAADWSSFSIENLHSIH